MEGLLKEKSWSVKLVTGFVYADQVRSKQCLGCNSNSTFVVYSYSNPDLVLFGCDASKCQHKLIRLHFEQVS